MTRGDIAISIFERLLDVAQTAGEVSTVLITSPYGTSYRGFEKRLNDLRSRGAKGTFQSVQRQRFHAYISKLKREGFIREGALKKLSLTEAGHGYLKNLLRKKRATLPTHYAVQKSSAWIIVSFDVPEKERRKRAWLREALKNLGFRMIHKSVWIGKVKIPERFLHNLRRQNIWGAVEIFEITKGGTLKHII